jgi:hypothetical protein
VYRFPLKDSTKNLLSLWFNDSLAEYWIYFSSFPLVMLDVRVPLISSDYLKQDIVTTNFMYCYTVTQKPYYNELIIYDLWAPLS